MRIFVLNALLCAATVTLVDFAFKAALKARFGRDEMAAFLGGFNLVSEAVVLVAQLFLTSRFLSRFGIFAALEARPAALLLLRRSPPRPASGPTPRSSSARRRCAWRWRARSPTCSSCRRRRACARA